MPKRNRKAGGRKRTPKKMVNKPRSQPNASASIVKGLSGIANQFMPGAGIAVAGVSRLLGYGAYTTAEADQLLASRVPSMNATLDRGVRISHHEFLGDVLSATGFSVLTYPLNPGLPTTFPWLSTVAAAFQEYELNGCVFYFKSTSASALNSTNTALGQIIGAVQYNPYLAAPPNKVSMLGLSSASDGKPSESNVYPVECKADMVLFRSKLVRAANVADDLAKYDHGNFFLGANGSQAPSTVGELHIVYDITLKKPRLITDQAAPGWYYHSYSNTGSAQGSAPFDGTVTTETNSLGVYTIGAKSNTICIPAVNSYAGTKYCLSISWVGTTAAVTLPTLSYSNCAAFNGIGGYSSQFGAPATGVNGVVACLRAFFAVTLSNTITSVTVSVGGTLPTSATWDLTLSECV